jgi:hypothetical protein
MSETSIKAPPWPSSNGTKPSVALQPPRRSVRVPELALGLLVTVGFALGAVLWHLNSIERVPALATAVSVQRGDVIEAGDLRVVYVSSDSDVARLGRDQSAAVVGRVAQIDMAAGTLLTESLVAPALAVTPGSGVVGLALEPGQFPSRGLAPGDVVSVVVPPDQPGSDPGDAVLASRASVFAIEELPSDRLLVSLLLDEQGATAVAAASSAPLRLVLVAG